VANDEYTLRTATPGDWDRLYRLTMDGFNETGDDEDSAVHRSLFEPERTIIATLGDEFAGTVAAYTRDLTIPGAIVPAAFVTSVGVEATHRRQGLLNRMMAELLIDSKSRGEPLAVLWASEGRIYQRYGYGNAVRRLSFKADREVQLITPPPKGDRLRSGVPADVLPQLTAVYERLRADRPGWASRSPLWWDYVIDDRKSNRKGASHLRCVMHEGPDGIDGYALFRTKDDWSPVETRRAVWLREFAAATEDAYQALWHFVLNMDLTRMVSFETARLDEPLLYQVNEPRMLEATLLDSLWVRLVDVPAALSARRYAAPVDLVIEVTDPILPENTGAWHLTAGPDPARCVPAERQPDLYADLNALGAAYLGDASLATLAAAGRVRELTPGALASATVAFGWYQAPSAIEVF
jgi:predicted acetyltransferase